MIDFGIAIAWAAFSAVGTKGLSLFTRTVALESAPVERVALQTRSLETRSMRCSPARLLPARLPLSLLCEGR